MVTANPHGDWEAHCEHMQQEADSSLARSGHREQSGDGPLADGWQLTVGHGHSGFGIYAHMTEYPEEGSILWRSLNDVQHEAYAEGRRDEQEELASVLPGITYMDPPDGGAPTILEQLQRQAKDAARYLWIRNHGLKYANVGLGTTCDGQNVVDFSPTFTIPEPVGLSYEDNEWSLTDLDAAIDAAMEGR